MYLVQSKEHTYNVSYVLNPRTGHISAQYHLTFENDYSTVNATPNYVAIKRYTGLYKLQPYE